MVNKWTSLRTGWWSEGVSRERQMIVIDHREKKRQDMLTEAYETPRNHTSQQKIEKQTAGPLLACCFAQSSKLSVINNQTNQLRCLELRLQLKPPAASIAFVKSILTAAHRLCCFLLPCPLRAKSCRYHSWPGDSSLRQSCYRNKGMKKIITVFHLTTDLALNNE